MHINKAILFAQIEALIKQKYQHDDKLLLLELCRIIIYNDPTKNCIVKRNVDDFILVHEKKAILQSLIAQIKSTLQDTL